jgi:dipeptidyl aminopeptidase/acylaminoacyl peptidase
MKILIRQLISIILLVGFGYGAGHAQVIVDTVAVSFPSYDQVEGIDWYYPRQAYDNARQNNSFQVRKIIYLSDGLRVTAFIAYPSQLKTKYPLIIFNRGGSVRNDIAYVHLPLFEKFVSEGYVVIAPALRQSEGGEGQDEVGGADLNDLMAIETLYKQFDFIDNHNVFMAGESRGGIMTMMAMREGFHVNAAATVGAITDFARYLNENHWIDPTKIWPDYAARKEQINRSRSALNWAEQINAPLLLLNGGKDPQVKPYHAINLALKLTELDKPYQLKIVEEGNHILSGGAMEERDLEMLMWFKKHMKHAPKP